MRDNRRPDPNRETCPRCGQRVGIHTTVRPGNVRGKFAVSTPCPYTIKRAGGDGTEGCRMPTAVIFDPYGHKIVFAPSFEALNHLIERETSGAS